LFKCSGNFFESVFCLYRDNCRILFSPQFRILDAIENPHPISSARTASHLPNIGNSIAHGFTISDILRLIHTELEHSPRRTTTAATRGTCGFKVFDEARPGTSKAVTMA
jgi:hypothetical protein